MRTEKRVFNKLFAKKPLKPAQLKKQKITLGLIDEINYEYQYLEDEVSRLSYSVEEWFDEKFDEWRSIGRDIYSVYFQNSEAFISEADVAGDKDRLIEIKQNADDLGIDVEEVYPDYEAHLELLEYLDNLEQRFEIQKQEFFDESNIR